MSQADERQGMVRAGLSMRDRAKQSRAFGTFSRYAAAIPLGLVAAMGGKRTLTTVSANEAHDEEQSHGDPKAKDNKRERPRRLTAMLHVRPAVAAQVHHQGSDFGERGHDKESCA